MLISRCSLAVTVVVALLLPSTATADVFDPLAPASVQGTPTIATDQADYQQNSEVILTGSGWQPGESVHIVVNDDGLHLEPWTHEATVLADADGNFVYPFDIAKYFVADYTVTATGVSGSASTGFTDAPFAANGCVVVLGEITVNTTDDPTPALDPDCSLREAIMSSNVLNGTVPGTVTKIVVPAGEYELEIAGRGENNDEEGDLDVRESVEIAGAGSGTTIVEANDVPATNGQDLDDADAPVDRVFHVVTPGTHLDLNNVTVRHGYANLAGGGIRVENGEQDSGDGPNALDLTNVVVTLNKMTSGNGGAGIYIDGFNVDTTVQSSDIVYNDTDDSCNGCDAGAIFNKGRSLDIDDSHLDHNAAGATGGALKNNNNGQVTIDDSTLNFNINNNSGAADLNGYGGAIYQEDNDSLITLTNSEVNNNTATGRGGGIYNQNGRILIDHSEVNDNTVDGPRDGGGIHNRSNKADPAAVRIIDSTVARNVAGRDGGGYFDDGSLNDESLFVNRSTFNDNTAAENGGGFRTKAFATIANSTIDNNHALLEGGGIWLIDRDVRLYNVTISDNDAPTGSGLRRNNAAGNNGDYFLSNTIIADNACSTETNANPDNQLEDIFNETPVGAANNLDTGDTCGFQVANASLLNANANLDTLGDNGGPTFTRALLATPTLSQAVDAGNDTVCDAPPVGGALLNDGIDQRHVPRPQGPQCDIGAYERAATIAGKKFKDLNTMGQKDLTDPGLEDWVINAYFDDGTLGELDGSEAIAATDTTDANGNYKLALGAGDYVVCEELQSGWTQSFPSPTTTPPSTGDCSAVSVAGDDGWGEAGLAVGDDLIDHDFGNFESMATVSGLKYDDVNEANGFDAGDTPLEGWVINAYADTDGDGIINNGEELNSPAATDTTAADGTYSLTLAAGKYVICEEQQGDWAQSEPANANCAALDDPVADGGHAVDLAAGGSEPNKNFGNYAALVSGMKFDDSDASPIGGWVIKAFADDTTGVATGPALATDTTAALDGTYTLGLQPGDYVICEESQAGWTQTDPTSGGTCPSGFEPNGYLITVNDTSDVFPGNDFGNIETPQDATLSGMKYDDQDENGQNDSEPGLEGWDIEAYVDANGNDVLDNGEENGPPAATDTTDSTGAYEMTLPAGVYIICEQLQADWAQSEPSNVACAAVGGAADGGHVLALTTGQTETGRDFGNYAGLVTGKKFDDVNRDGDKTGDSGLGGWVINAYADTDESGDLDATEAAALPVASATTAADGTYTLALQAGDYVICEESQAGKAQSAPLNNKCKEASGAAAPGGYAIKDLDTMVDYPDRDFGNHEGALISGLKYDDRNGDATNAADPNDPPVPGFTIKAYADGSDGGDGVLSAAEAGAPAVATSTTSNPEGEYFLPVPAGQYVICETLPSGWVQSDPAPAGNECDLVSGAGNGGIAVTVAAGAGADARDFGNYRTATLNVTKTYSDSGSGSVSVTLTCDSGTVAAPNPTNTPATFTVNGFAAGAKCTATENPVPPGYAQDNSDCTNVEIGVKLTCNILNVKSVVLLTQGGCSFDRDTSRQPLRQFPLIYTPEGAASKLSATNPGEFFMNAAYSGPKDHVTIKIPFPFVTASTNPVHVYSGVNVHTAGGKTCYAPNGPSLGTQAGPTPSNWTYATDGFASPQKMITVPVPATSDFVYVRIHLKYGLKGVAGGCTPNKSNGNATCTTMNGALRTPSLVIGTSPTLGYQPYTFSFTDVVPDSGTITQSETVESFNIFKKDPGIAGLVLQAPSNTPIPNAKVEIWQGSPSQKKATVYTDEDGWYVWPYKYSGKATTFTVKLIAGFGGVLAGQTQNVTMKSNGYIVVNFTVPP